ncbi:hypothetical protein A4A49_44321, partial [Nicotiana attenuata]
MKEQTKTTQETEGKEEVQLTRTMGQTRGKLVTNSYNNKGKNKFEEETWQVPNTKRNRQKEKMKAIEAKNGEQYAENNERMQEQNQEGEQNIKDRTNSKRKTHKKKKMPRKKSIVLIKPAVTHGQSKANKVINKKSKQHTSTEQLASEILGTEDASQQQVMKDTNAQTKNYKAEHSANQSSKKDHKANQSQEIAESSSTDADSVRHTITEKRTMSSKNKEQESEQEEMNDRRYYDGHENHKTCKKDHNRVQYPSSSIDTEIRNQPPIKLVLELFGDDQDKEATQCDQNNQQQQTNSTSSNIKKDKQRGNQEGSQEIAKAEENSCLKDEKKKQ